MVHTYTYLCAALLVALSAGYTSSGSVCNLPKVVGRCRAAFRRYYFDSVLGQCKLFIYGGCGGNANNFRSLDLCNTACPPKPVDVCKLPKVVGPCRARFPRYFYNSATGDCEKFFYGGCRGNANNFISPSECNVACPSEPVNVCKLPKVIGPCEGAFPRYFFNSATGKCDKFSYGGCQGNGNNFEVLEACRETCETKPVNVCEQPKVVGPCKALIPRYFYNKSTKKCEFFYYGGCGANGNNFESLADCSKKCAPEPPKHVCEQPKVVGPCKAAFPRYFYNSATNRCEKFTYGGCQGNDNNFRTLEDCNSACPCSLPAKPGNCRAYIPSWYYNANTGTCQRFVYGGCNGNNNRFSNQQSCNARCGKCSLPKDIGPCDGVFPRWFYNARSKQCERFDYGGCDGNANRFKTEADCERSCEVNIYQVYSDRQTELTAL